MSVLKLTYCQLIKIVLSQIGGNPLQQIYSQLSQGQAQITTRSGIIPNQLAQIKSLVDQITNTIHAAQVAVSDFSTTLEDIGGQFFQNPLGTAIAAAILQIDTRIETVDALLVATPGDPTLTAERAALVTTRATLVTHKNNTDRLSGVGPQSATNIAGGCSLQDLLGSACTPNNDVPDVDLKALLDSLKNKDYITSITEKIKNATGYSDYQTALATFQTTVSGLNASFIASINKASIRNAVTSQITQMVYNLLTGCGGQVLDLTLKPDIKTKVAAWVELLQQQQDNSNAYLDAYGNVVTTTSTEVSTTSPTLSVSIPADT